MRDLSANGSPSSSREDALIARHFAPLAGAGGLGLKDDAAILSPPPGHDLIMTADALVAGVHFFADDPAAAIAAKALAVNLSDLAAKAGRPLGFLMSLALPGAIDDVWLADFAGGLREEAERGGCPLLGGDTVKTPGPLMVAITAFGAARRGRSPTRLDARPGDAVLVSGTIGDAALGLIVRRDPARAAGWALERDDAAHLAARYLRPVPRLALIDVVARYARAAMDVSDGLILDLSRLARASGVAATIASERVPLSRAVARAVARETDALEAALTGGDDYEVLMTTSPDMAEAAIAAAASAGVALTRIGAIVAGAPGDVVVTKDGLALPLTREGYSHF